MNADSIQEVQAWLHAFLWPEPDGRQRAKRQRILTAATALFVRYGYRRTPMEEVASAAGVAKGTVYLYYRNKAELVLHAIALEKCGYVARLLVLLGEPMSPRERLRSLIALGLISVMEMPLLSRLISGDRELALALSEADVPILDRINAFRTDFLINLLGEATDGSLSPEVLRDRARVLIDLISGIATGGALAAQGPDADAYVWALADMLVDGVGAPAGERLPRPVWSQVSASDPGNSARLSVPGAHQEAAL